MSSYILGIDQGTTGTTVLLFDRKGRVAGRGYQTFPQHYPRPGWVEHDPEEIWISLLAALRKLFTSSRISPKKIIGIGITNQRETTLLWDPRTGKSYHRAIVWQCRRTTPRIQQLQKRKGLRGRVKKRTGLALDPYFSASKIEWLLDHIPGLKKKAKNGRVLFGTMDTYLLWRLTGRASHATDWTNASRTMLFNIRTKKWDPSLLKIFNIPRSILPEARPSKSFFGKTKGLPFLPDGIPVSAMIGDQQAALFGQGCVEMGDAKNTYGTGGFLMIQLGSKPSFSKRGFLTTLAVGRGGVSSYALEGSVFIAGAALQWIRDGLKWIRSAAETERIAKRFRKASPEPHVFMVPAFVGLGAPYWDPEARGAFLGLTRGTTREEMITATLESLAYQTADLVQEFFEDGGTLRSLKVDGGASQNNYLMQFQADLVGRKVLRPAVVEATVLGAAKLAGMNLNFWKNSRIFERVEITQFKPNLSSARRSELLSLWRRAVKRVL